jgi:hypothetical protein
VDNALPTIAVVLIGLTGGVSSAFMWVSAALTGLFFLSFLVLMPREGQTTATWPSVESRAARPPVKVPAAPDRPALGASRAPESERR